MFRLVAYYLFVCFFVFLAKVSPAQELNCKVQVLTPKLQINDPQVFQTLENSINEFLNNRKWTDDQFQPNEKIELNIIISITQEVSADYFKATVTIQSLRPVHSSTYSTALINHVDDQLEFQYAQYDPLIFNPDIFNSNLTSFLGFYAYLALALDYESFSLKGGEMLLNKVQTIVNNAQNRPEPGWNSTDSKRRNRYWIVENLLNAGMDEYRQIWYDYHRNGLDMMYKDAAAGRKKILECLNKLQTINKEYPNTFILRLFFNAKNDELIGVFSEAPQEEKDEAIKILNLVDPSNSNKYKKINKK